MNVLGVIVVLTLFLAGLMQVAVIRDRSIYLSSTATSCRWIVAAGLWGLGWRFAYLLYDDHFVVPWHSLFCIGLVGLGLTGLELQRFVPQAFMDTEPSAPVPLDEKE